MPKEIPLFLIDKNKMAAVVKKFMSAGLTDNIVNVTMFGSVTHIAYLKTDGTVLRATIDHINDNTYCTLYFEDKPICRSSINSVTLYRNIKCVIEQQFDDLPSSLLKPKAMVEEEKKREARKPDILLPIGNKKPQDIDLSHLGYLGISESAFTYNEEEKIFFLKLLKAQGFSYEKKYFFPARHLIEYTLTYQGKPFARIIDYFLENDAQLQANPLQIALARGKADNIKEVPSYLSDKKEGGDKLTVAGTIDSCIGLIKSNQVKLFELAYHRHHAKIAKELNYTLLGADQINDLVSALSHNSTIEEINLSGDISKEGFLKIINGVKKIYTLRELSFHNMHINITLLDMPEIYDAIASMPLDTSGFSTDDKNYPDFDGLQTAYQTLLLKIDEAKKVKLPHGKTVKTTNTTVGFPEQTHYGPLPSARLFHPKTALAAIKKPLVVPSAGDMKGILSYLQQVKEINITPDAISILQLLQDKQFDFKSREYCAIIKALNNLDLLKDPAIFKVIAQHPENNNCTAICGYSKEVPSKIYPFWSIVSTKQSFQSIHKDRWQERFASYVQSAHWDNQGEKEFALSFVK